ncbi:MAG: UbiX family flavin prenyltransferase [Lachnospirales bacterium]
MKKIIIGVTGASGSIIAINLINELIQLNNIVYLVATKEGEAVVEFETGKSLLEHFENSEKVIICDNDDLFSPIASGSFYVDKMVVVPCTMNTLGQLANGITPNLLTRSADCIIKQKRDLIIVPRETPLSTIHLNNMLTLSKCNVTILPPSPAFYHHPKTLDDVINFVVGKILDSLQIENNVYKHWD